MSCMARLLELLKSLPVDVGQGGRRFTTQGKLIALAHVAPGEGKLLLDVGCREGHQSEQFRQQGYRVTSIDIESTYRHAQIVDVDERLPFSSDTFDVVWCSEVLEHLLDPPQVVAELRRVSKPGGLLVLTTPNTGVWFQSVMSLVGLTPRRVQNPGHRHFFGARDIRALFPRAEILGFFPYAVVKRTIRRGVGVLSPTFVVVERQGARGQSSEG